MHLESSVGEGERRRKKMDLQLIPKASRVGVNLYCATFTQFLENRPKALSVDGILGGWGVGGGTRKRLVFNWHLKPSVLLT